MMSQSSEKATYTLAPFLAYNRSATATVERQENTMVTTTSPVVNREGDGTKGALMIAREKFTQTNDVGSSNLKGAKKKSPIARNGRTRGGGRWVLRPVKSSDTRWIIRHQSPNALSGFIPQISSGHDRSYYFPS